MYYLLISSVNVFIYIYMYNMSIYIYYIGKKGERRMRKKQEDFLQQWLLSRVRIDKYKNVG